VKHLNIISILLFISLQTLGQDILLLSEDFENGGGSVIQNSSEFGGNSGSNTWIVNNAYSGAPMYANTTPQNITNGGTISFGPNSKYLHIHDSNSGIFNNNYAPTNSSDRFAVLADGLCTYGMQEVHISFFWLCEGSPNAFGSLVYSADGGPWTAIGPTQFSNQTNWQYLDITDPNFSNVGSLRFGFRWQNFYASTNSSQSFSIDDVTIVGTYSTTNPVSVQVTGISPNPVCAGEFVTVQWQLSEPLCDGNYQIELSNSAGNFPGPFNSWVTTMNYPQTTGSVTVQLPNNAAPGNCYKFRINRLSPPPAITGTASFCFQIIDCPNEITTLQPVVTIDTNAVCVGSAIDIPFNSTGVYNNNNVYTAQLSNADGTFGPSPPVVGSFPNNDTYDPSLGQLPGSVSGLIPNVTPGCNYFIRVVSSSPQATGTVWGPFCIQQCDITTNNNEDLNFCINDCATDPDGETQTISVEVNSFNNTATYGAGNIFTTQLLSSINFSQIGSNGILGEVAGNSSTQLDVHIPCKDSLPLYGIPLGMNYMRVIGTQSSNPENSLGSLIRVTIGAYRNVPQEITSFEYPSFTERDTFCVGQTVYLNFSPFNSADNSTYLWQCNAINGGQPFESPSGATSNALFVLLNSPGILNFSIQETNYECVSEWTPVHTIVVLGNPNANIVGPINQCLGDTSLFQVQFSPNSYYSWNTTAPANTIAYQDTSNNVLNISFNQTGSYTLSMNVLNQCGSSSDSHTVNVLNLPIANAGPDQTICEGQTATLNAQTGTSYQYAWFNNSTNVGTGPQVTVTPNDSSVYILNVTGPGQCHQTDTLIVNVNSPPTSVVLSDSLCVDNYSTLTLNSTINGLYAWSTGESTASIIISDTGVYQLNVSVPNSICPTPFDYVITEATPPLPQLFTDSICLNVNSSLQLTSPIIGIYEWNTGDLNESITVSDTGQYLVQVFQIDQPCPTSYLFEISEMTPPPTIYLVDSVCPNGFYPIELGSPLGGLYTWSTGSQTPYITVNDTGIYVLTVQNFDFPCPYTFQWAVSSDTCIVPPTTFCYVPNSVTANGDNLNDVFGPVFTDSSLLTDYEILIYNRWGAQVFQSTDPNEKWAINSSTSWHYVQEDVYVYKIRYRQVNIAGFEELNGHVLIIR
jgi:gliding motility-associated-like protein